MYDNMQKLVTITTTVTVTVAINTSSKKKKKKKKKRIATIIHHIKCSNLERAWDIILLVIIYNILYSFRTGLPLMGKWE